MNLACVNAKRPLIVALLDECDELADADNALRAALAVELRLQQAGALSYRKNSWA